MPGHWWTHRDAGRVVARAYHGKPMTDEEIGHLRASAMVLLTGPLELDAEDAVRLRRLLAWLESAREEAS